MLGKVGEEAVNIEQAEGVDQLSWQLSGGEAAWDFLSSQCSVQKSGRAGCWVGWTQSRAATQPMEAGGRVSQNSYIQEIEASGVPEAGMEWMQSKH